jgi:hypothetical protein
VAKQSGLGDNLYLDGYDISGDVGELGKIGGGVAPIEVTGIDKSAVERIGGVRDGGIDFTAFFNPETIAGGGSRDGVHKVLSTLPLTDRVVTYFRGTALGNPAANLVSKQVGYDPKRGQSGEFTFDISAVANGYGLGWGAQLTAGKRTDTTATNGTGVDFGLGSSGTGPSTFGAQFFLHVFAFTGTSVTVKIQESADNGGADPFADVTGGAFTAATGITAQRLETARGQTVKRYLRAVTTGTFSNAVFAVTATRNDQSVVF